jgi:hypothetical protein
MFSPFEIIKRVAILGISLNMMKYDVHVEAMTGLLLS